jgi:hypothetical protein
MTGRERAGGGNRRSARPLAGRPGLGNANPLLLPQEFMRMASEAAYDQRTP